MSSFPAAPLICTVALVTAPRLERLAVVPEPTLTTRVSVAPPDTPPTVQARPASWVALKVAVRPLAIVTAWMLLKATALTSTLAVKARVLVPPPPSTISFATPSEAPE